MATEERIMGWLFGFATRRELVDHLCTQDNGDWHLRTLARAFSGNNLWAVQEVTRGDQAPERFIVLYLLRGRNGSRHGWGYKDVEASMGPRELTCPVSFLNMVPEPTGEDQAATWEREWRAKVRARHAAKAALRKALRPGVRIKLREGCRPRHLTIVLVGRRIVADSEAGRCRVAPRFLEGAEIVP
jgi:hypothetical protein